MPLRIDLDLAEVILSLKSKEPFSVNALTNFFGKRAHEAVRDAADNVKNNDQRQKDLGRWEVLDELSKLVQAAEDSIEAGNR